MFAADSPGREGFLETFVASTIEDRLPRAANQRPRIVSDCPPSPLTQDE